MHTIQDEIKEQSELIYKIAGREFDIDNDAELAKVLFEDLGLPPVKKDADGYSVDDDVLWALMDSHRIIQEIWAYQNMRIAEKIPSGTRIIEQDYRGRIVGWGSDADYDTHAVDVQNGEGYYDENGRYHSFGYCE